MRDARYSRDDRNTRDANNSRDNGTSERPKQRQLKHRGVASSVGT
jgi:hypothetical protein